MPRDYCRTLRWHALNNILTTTYFLLLLIHLQANSNPNVDIVLRYIAFTSVWIAQIKDEYWQPFYTALVVAAFSAPQRLSNPNPNPNPNPSPNSNPDPNPNPNPDQVRCPCASFSARCGYRPTMARCSSRACVAPPPPQSASPSG